MEALSLGVKFAISIHENILDFSLPSQCCGVKCLNSSTNRGCPRGVMVKVMDCGIVISEFVLQSRFYVHFRANTLGKGMKPLIPPSYGLNSTTTVLLG